MTTKTCSRKGCGYKQTIMKEKRKQSNTWRCTQCSKINKLSILLIAVFAIALGSLGPAYAASQNFIFDDEFLVDTATWNNTQHYSDNSTGVDIYVKWAFLFPANTTFNPEPVKADPLGTFYELLIGDKAGIFSSVVDKIIEAIEKIEAIIQEILEPEPEYTHAQQILIDDLNKFCDKLSEKLKAIGLAYDFRLEHTEEWYADHELQAKLKAQDCRARIYLGDNVLSSQYITFAKEAILDAEAFNQTITTQGPTHSLEINNTAIAIKAAEFAQTTIDDSTYLGYPEQIADITIRTNQTQFGVMTPTEKHTYEEENRIKNLKELCSILWSTTGNGTTSLRSWNTNLTNGMCDNFMFTSEWDFDINKRVEKQIDLRSVIDNKLTAGEKY